MVTRTELILKLYNFSYKVCMGRNAIIKKTTQSHKHLHNPELQDCNFIFLESVCYGDFWQVRYVCLCATIKKGKQP